MAQIIASIISPAIGVAVSPFPIVGLILTLLSKNGRKNSLCYTGGWVFGNAAAFFLGVLLMTAVGTTQDGKPFWTKVVSGVLGVALIVMGINEFRKRPKKGEEPKTPAWFEKMSGISPFGSFGFGFLLSALNIKNFLLGFGAGAALSALAPNWGQVLGGALAFLLIGCCTIYIPMLAVFIAGDKLNHVLAKIRDWLIRYNSIIMTVLLLLLGISMIAKIFS